MLKTYHWKAIKGVGTIDGVRSYLIVYFVFWLLFALLPCQDLSFLLNWSKLDLLYRIKYLQNSYKNNDTHKYDQLFTLLWSFKLRNHRGPWRVRWMVIYEVSRLLTGSCPGSSYLWNEFVNEVLFQSDKIQKDNKKLRFWEIVIFGILNLTHQVRNNPKYYRFLIPLD